MYKYNGINRKSTVRVNTCKCGRFPLIFRGRHIFPALSTSAIIVYSFLDSINHAKLINSLTAKLQVIIIQRFGMTGKL